MQSQQSYLTFNENILIREEDPLEFERNKTRQMKDSIYTEKIQFTLDFWKFIDNPIYARLKNLYQVGTLYHVFPGATHTRFSHSLGVGHLAQRQMQFLYDIRSHDKQMFT